MRKLVRIASRIDQIGMRGLVARLASLAYKNRQFETDGAGRWVNIQDDCVIVSPHINTMPFSVISEVARRNWCHSYTPKPGDTVIDVGSGIGDEVVVFSKMVGEHGRVIAIEAAPSTFACLQETVRRSGLSNVTCLQIAVAEGNGVAFIEDREAHLANSLQGNSGIEVKAMSLDTVINDLALKKIDLLKMNIEGAEKMAVLGLRDSASRVRNVAISCHDFIAVDNYSFFRTKKEVLATMRSYGFIMTGRSEVQNEPWIGDYVYGSKSL